MALTGLAGVALPAAAAPTEPPYGGTIFIDPDIITDADPTVFVDASSTGRGLRTVFDRRTDRFEQIDAYLFLVRFGDGTTSEGIVNPEFGSVAAAQAVVERYATELGRVPTASRARMTEIWIHRGDQPFGGGNDSVLIHTEQGDAYIADGILAETLVHELAHTSLDPDHAASDGWLAAQAADPTFISTYARDNPTREDIAETFLPWLALRHRSSRIDATYRNDIEQSVPNRLTYFDGLGLDLTPIAGGSLVTDPLAAFDGDAAQEGQLGVEDPTTVSLRLSALRFPVAGTAAAGVLSRNDTYPDALAAAALSTQGPLLYTDTTALRPEVADELQRSLPAGATVYLLGGVDALSEQVEAAVQQLGFTTTRLAGGDRIETALAVGTQIGGGSIPRVALARAFPATTDTVGTSGWADSVTGGAWAADRGLPVVVNGTNRLDDRVLTWLQAVGVQTVEVLGGPAAIGDAVVDALQAEGFTVNRTFGNDRVATSAAISTDLWGQVAVGPRRYLVIPGFAPTGWALGLAAAGLSASSDAPMLAVNPGAASGPAHDQVRDCAGPVVNLLFLGPTARFSPTGAAGDQSWMHDFIGLDGACP